MSWSGDGALMPDTGKGDWGRLPSGPSIPSVVRWAGRTSSSVPLGTWRQSLRDELLSQVCVHCPLKFFPSSCAWTLRGDSSGTPVCFRSPMKPATRLALQDPAKCCQSPRTRWRPVSGGPFGVAPRHIPVSLQVGVVAPTSPRG